MMCAFLATLVLGVQTGVLVAMGFSLVLFVSKSSRPHIAELGRLFGACAPPTCVFPFELAVARSSCVTGGIAWKKGWE
jgi:hypothetical protein